MDNHRKQEELQLMSLMEQLRHISPTEHMYTTQQLISAERSLHTVASHYAHTYTQVVELEREVAQEQEQLQDICSISSNVPAS